MRHPYLKRKPPKSTGREEFGDEFVAALLHRVHGHDPQDVIATASWFTAYSIHDAYTRFVERRMRADELIVSGGGAKNQFIVNALRIFFDKSSLTSSDKLGVPSEAKEAMCFAILANETLAGHPTNIPSVTGAGRSVVLGKVCRP
jgi:anhydro-N-acetylmuramic acid kinase